MMYQNSNNERFDVLYPTSALHNQNRLCYDNKVMSTNQVELPVATTSSPHHVLRLNATDCDKTKPDSATDKCRRLLWPKRVRFTVLSDVTTIILVLSMIIVLELGWIPERKLGFRCKDPTLSYPYKGDTIKVIPLLTGCYFGPLVLITIIETIREKSIKDIRLGVIWEHYKELLIGLTFVLLITEIAKMLMGEHRPHFFDVCMPDANEDCVEGAFISDYKCMNTAFSKMMISDAAKSFPSGHSSLSVFSSLFCAYVIQARMPSAISGRLLKPFLIAVCISWGLLCSLSRITDRRHHWWDVLSGTVLGMLSVIYFTTILHRKQKQGLRGVSGKSISSTMLLDVKNKSATSVRV